MNLSDALKNSKGQIFYGMHFYPGVAQYDTDQGSYRVFVNEATIRQLNPTFAGRPVFVEHVDGVDEDLAVVRNEADGWVIESFYNEADGKTWAKFIIVSDRGLAAVKRGYRLSNAYIPMLVDHEATWNGVDYQKTVTGGEFEHLAIVQNPRYEESVIMTPDEFKAYNVKLKADLVKFANSKDKKGDKQMGLKLFKRQKLENAVDIENTMVELPKSKKEISIAQLVSDHDAILNMNGYANGDHMVMSVNKLVKAYQSKCKELEAMNAKGDEGGEPGTGEDDIDPEVSKNEAIEDSSADVERDDNGDESLDNVEDEGKGATKEGGDNNEDEDQGKKRNKKMKNAAREAAELKIAEAKVKAARLKNAHLKNRDDGDETARVDMAEDQVARGKSRYGSGN
jgi:hypothetical protein